MLTFAKKGERESLCTHFGVHSRYAKTIDWFRNDYDLKIVRKNINQKTRSVFFPFSARPMGAKLLQNLKQINKWCQNFRLLHS